MNTQSQGELYDHSSNQIIMSSKEFSWEMNINWNELIFPKIKARVYKTLKALQETQFQSSQANYFEVYGFDFILDENYSPWVIEINLSPDCQDIAPWLTKMLDDMAHGLMDWLERQIYTKT